MRWLTFTKRTAKEIILDPLTVAFGLGMPVALLLLLSAINSGIPEGYGPSNFKIENLTPGVNVFAMSFLTLMAGLLLSKDRGSSLLQRLLTTPLTAVDYIVGYMLPLIPIALMQGIICYVIAMILGLSFTANIFLAILISILPAIMFSALGLLLGTLLNEKQVGGICGALVTNLTAWLSGAWFSLDMVGGAFKTVGQILPFYHAVEMQKAVLHGSYSGIFTEGHIWVVLGYCVVLCVLAVVLFTSRMREK